MQPHCSSCEYIIDIYFQGDLTHLWTKTVDGQTRHYPLWYHPKIYIAADADYDVTGRLVDKNRSLMEIAEEVSSLEWVYSIRTTHRMLDNFAELATEVLEVRLVSYKDFDERMTQLLREHHYNVFNCDINRRQHFFIEEEVAPMCGVHISTDRFRTPFLRLKGEYIYLSEMDLPDLEEMEPWERDHGKQPLNMVSLEQYDSISDILYFLPPVRVLSIEFDIDMSGYFPVKHDPIRSLKIKLKTLYQPEHTNTEELEELMLQGSERQIFQDLQQLIDRFDPDVL
ncbi:MAG: hypothetical protein ACXAE3_05570, partial [Candidatus Kariarchaeaceae archaeon]